MSMALPSKALLGVVVAAAGLGLSPAGFAASATVVLADGPTSVAAYKAAHDTDPHVALSARDAAALVQRQSAAHQFWTQFAAAASSSSANLIANQFAQIYSYYCGPASVSEALGARNIPVDQNSMASRLRTTTGGTAWSGVNANVPSPTGYPVRDVLNFKVGTTWYDPVGVPYTPSSGDVSTNEADLVTDVYNYKYPVVGDAWKVPGGPHLVGHPASLEIFHWFEIRGFQSSGATTNYEDSVHGATSISWSGSVPAYSSYDSPTLVTIVGGRGYVW